jgi:hypothetical protein
MGFDSSLRQHTSQACYLKDSADLGPPNFFLALVPPNIDPHSLNTLVAFAVGGLLGDVFLHLLPQGIFFMILN